MGSRGRKAKAWWAALSPERRAKLKREQGQLGKRAQLHHYEDDRACPTCGTDSSVGCIANALHGMSN